MSFKPLVIDVGQFKQLPAGQALDAGGWTLPTSGGTEDYVLTADAGGNAIWAEAAASFDLPTADDQILISTGVGTAAWSTAGNDQVMASGATGEVAWEDKPFGYDIPAPAGANEVHVGTGAGTSGWSSSLNGLTYCKVDNIVIDNFYVTSLTGTISLWDDNMTTTGGFTGGSFTDGTATLTGGDLTGVKLASLTSNGFVKTSGGDGTLSVDTSTYLTSESDTLDTVCDRGATTDQSITTGGLTTTGTVDAGNLQVDDININGSTITSSTGLVQFGNDHPYTTGMYYSYRSTGGVFQAARNDTSLADGEMIGSFEYYTNDGSVNGAGICGAIRYECDGTWNGVTNEGHMGFWTQDESDDVGNMLERMQIHNDGQIIVTSSGSLVNNGTNQQLYGTMYTDGSGTGYSGLFSYGPGGASVSGTLVIDLPGGFQDTMMGLRILGYNYSSRGGWSAVIGGYTYGAQGRWLQHHASVQGKPPFESIRLGWNGNTSKACIMLGTTSSTWAYPTVLIESLTVSNSNQTAYQSGWAMNFYTDESNFTGQTGYYDPVTVERYTDLLAPTTSGTIPVSSGASGAVTWTTSLTTLTNLTVDNININGATISSSSGAISFSNENLTSTGTVVGSNIPSPTADDQALTSSAAGVASWNTTGLADVLAQEVPSASGAERKFVLTADPGDKFEIEAAPWTLTLTSDEDIYVETTGNDTTGDGSAIFPFASLTRAIEYLGGLYIGDYTVTVNIGEGVFTEAGTLTFQHPFGSQVIWKGVSEQITSQNTTSIGSTGTSLGFNNLYYYDVTFTLPVGKSVSVGDYIAVREVSGGTNGEALYGCHYVSGWVSGTRVATVRVVYKNGATKATGTVTCTVELIKSVVAFSNKNGLKISGPYHAGLWQGLVLQGDYDTTNTSAKYGLWLLNTAVASLGGTSTSGEAIGVVGFQTGLYAQNNAMIFGDYCFVSRCGTRCANAQNGGILNLRYARLSGANNNGIFCFNGSTAAAQYVKCVALGSDSVFSYQGSFIDARSAYVDQNNATYAFTADRWSGVDANSSSYSDSINPATGGNNDGSYVIIT